MQRRTFIRAMAGGAATAALGGAEALAASLPAPGAVGARDAAAKAKAKAQVVRVRDDKARTGDEQFDDGLLAAMLDRALMKLTNAGTPQAAWRSLFSPKDVVGLKVNCLAGPPLSTHPVVVNQIVRGLRLAGVPDGQIYVWERFTHELQRAGFEPRDEAGSVHYVGIDGRYDDELTTSGSVGSRFTPIVSRLCTALINVPVLKDHLLAGLGVGMKNFYGAIHNPNKYHDNNCDPYVADVNACPFIRDRLRLVACDALTGQYDGGPTLRPHRLWQENGLLASRDPVALDAIAGQVINERRIRAGLPAIPPPPWLATASRYGLGEHAPARIEVINL
jgi:uncharacterized protein (DUF362 family)